MPSSSNSAHGKISMNDSRSDVLMYQTESRALHFVVHFCSFISDNKRSQPKFSHFLREASFASHLYGFETKICVFLEVRTVRRDSSPDGKRMSSMSENKPEEKPLNTPEKTSSVPSESALALHTPENQRSETDEADEKDDEVPEDFRKKHPELAGAGAPGHVMQRKRLERGHRYFDSGDYNMARAKTKKAEGVTVSPNLRDALDATGEDHPTPDTIPHKKYPPGPGINKLREEKDTVDVDTE